MKLCKGSGKLMGYNSYFGGYYCTSCGRMEVEKKRYTPVACKSVKLKSH